MIRDFALVGALTLAFVGAACSSSVNGPGNEAGSGAGNNAGANAGQGAGGSQASSGGSSSAGTSSAGTSSGGSSGFSLDCQAPNNGRPTLRLLTRLELENTLNDVFPMLKGQWSDSLPASVLSEAGFDNDASTTVGTQFATSLLELGKSVGAAVSGDALATLLPCSTTAADRACAETFVNQYGRRLFRRPLTQKERERYLTLFDTAKASGDFKTAIKWLTAGLIQSPNAVYRSELGTDMGNGQRTLTPFEVASELSYTFTATAPSEELLAKAEQGELGDLVAQARAMLATDAGKQQVQRFFEGYLSYTNVAAASKAKIQNFNPVALDMIRETRAFIDEIVIKKGQGLTALLTANTTNPTVALANYYGFPAPAADFASVERPSNHGVGILSQGAFLASHANSDATSPTKRGLFAYYKLLCQPKLTPPKNVPTIDTAELTTTTRERYERAHLTRGTTCNGCHQYFDPIGFGFEHFDEGGRYRAQENGVNIDASTWLPTTDGSAPVKFDGEEELMQQLAKEAVSSQCFVAYLATFGYGTRDSCLAPSHAEDLRAGTMGIVEVFARLAEEPHFTVRNAK